MSEPFLPEYTLQSCQCLHIVHGNDTGIFRIGQNAMILYIRNCRRNSSSEVLMEFFTNKNLRFLILTMHQNCL